MDNNRTGDIISKVKVQSKHGTDFILTVSTTDDYKKYTVFVEDQVDSNGNNIHCSDFMIINYPDSLQNQIMSEYTLDDLNKLSKEKSFEELEYIRKYVVLADEQFDRRFDKIIDLFLNKHVVEEKKEFDFILEAKNNADTNNGPSAPDVKNDKQPFMPNLKETSFTPNPNAPGFDLPKDQPQCSTVTNEFEEHYYSLHSILKSLLLKLPSDNYKIDNKIVYVKDYDIIVEEKNSSLILGKNSITKKSANGDQGELRFDKLSLETKFRIIRLMLCISFKLRMDLAQGGIH